MGRILPRMSESPFLSLVVPAYNEEGTIAVLLRPVAARPWRTSR